VRRRRAEDAHDGRPGAARRGRLVNGDITVSFACPDGLSYVDKTPPEARCE